MINPFDKVKEKDKHEFFEQMATAIASSVETWMLEKYPRFDMSLDRKIEEISRLQNEFKLLINDVKLDTRNKRQEDALLFRNDMEKFLKKNYPEVSHSIVDTAAKLKAQAKRLQEREKTLDDEVVKLTLKNVMNRLKKAFEDEAE